MIDASWITLNSRSRGEGQLGVEAHRGWMHPGMGFGSLLLAACVGCYRGESSGAALCRHAVFGTVEAGRGKRPAQGRPYSAPGGANGAGSGSKAAKLGVGRIVDSQRGGSSEAPIDCCPSVGTLGGRR
jgi:hypothetical protein